MIAAIFEWGRTTLPCGLLFRAANYRGHFLRGQIRRCELSYLFDFLGELRFSGIMCQRGRVEMQPRVPHALRESPAVRNADSFEVIADLTKTYRRGKAERHLAWIYVRAPLRAFFCAHQLQLSAGGQACGFEDLVGERVEVVSCATSTGGAHAPSGFFIDAARDSKHARRFLARAIDTELHEYVPERAHGRLPAHESLGWQFIDEPNQGRPAPALQ
ncbi:hypothetical protein DT23_14930 [Thioclava indica]|uniref:Uncharacterized protein n=1 Tax=Thioclava indica TaxID=1353528 RepID=A0A074JQX0_9RHOB|nr:hypothetical protein DT23_14930 [Thioclava indica]